MTKRSLARRLLFTGAAITGALSFHFASQTKFDSDLLSVLPADLPEVRGINLYRNLFLDHADFLIVLESEDQLRLSNAVRELHEHIIAKLPELQGRAVWQAPWVGIPELAGELAAYAWCLGPPENLQHLEKTLTDPDAALAKIDAAIERMSGDLDLEAVKKISLDPLGITDIDLGADIDLTDLGGLSFSSSDKRIRLITIDAPPLPNDIANLRVWDQKLADALASWRTPSTVKAYVTGRSAYMVELEDGMKAELIGSVSFTVAAVLLLFYAFYGRLRPLFALGICLCLTFLITFAIATFLYHRLGILSVGFAAILIGLVVDYGVVIYQELQASKSGVRGTVRLLLPPIFWAAFTTGGVFLFLSRSALPGIAQLGILVAIGVAVGAAVMVLIFTPLAAATKARRHGGESGLPSLPSKPARFSALAIAALSTLILATLGPPQVISDPETLRPTSNLAGTLYDSLTDRLEQNELGRRRIVATGSSEADVAATLRSAQAWASAENNLPNDTRLILPTALWPDPESTPRNRPSAAAIAAAAPAIKAVLEDSFEGEAIRLFEEATSYFHAFSQAPPDLVPAPANAFSEAVLGNLISREPGGLAALGTFDTSTDRDTDPLMASLRSAEPKILSGGWEHLTPQIRRLFAKDLGSVVLPIAGILALILLLVFRRPVPVALSFLTLILSMASLLAVMRLTGITWNLFNLAAVPLLLGLGLDYSIHMNLAAARAAAGDLGADRRVARALLLCGLSSAAGFGSLSWSHHPGLSSLGAICGIGIILTMLTAVFIVPALHTFRPTQIP